jgi:hypothetical protein
MNIDVRDASNYFKGLLLLIRKDRRITEVEIALMTRIGRTLGFEPGFCATAIRDVLDNKYIVELPVTLSSKPLAEKFVKDGLTLAYSDKEVHPLEEEWLRAVADANGLEATWFDRERERIVSEKNTSGRLEIDDLTVAFRQGL